MANLGGILISLYTGILLVATSGARNDELEELLGEDYELNRAYLSSLPQPYEIVYPIQIRKNDRLDTISTRDHSSKHRHAHFHHTAYQINMLGRKLRIRLELNKDLLAKGLRQKRHVDEKTQMITEGPVEHCYYQGVVRRAEESMVILSTCYGLSGILQMHNESFIIQPLRMVHNLNYTRHPHVVYKPLPAEKKNCANDRGMWIPFQELHRGEFLRKLKIMKTNKVDRDVLIETKYMELGLVLDYSMYLRMNQSYSLTVNYAIQLANIIDAYYRELRIHVHLVFIEVWNMREQFDISPNVRETLHTFMQYWESTAKPVRAAKPIEYDLVHFITTKSFVHGEVGMAIPDSVCSKRAVSVSQDPDQLDPEQAASVAAHMIGHTLGMKHDTWKCECEDQDSCMMDRTMLSSEQPHPHHFSWCSEQYLNDSLMANLGACLYATPFDDVSLQSTYKQTCGNKIQERGEECDCGTEQECEEKDPCCDFSTCLLKPWATCRMGPCCHNCSLLPTTHICRPPLTDCDVPEFCDGFNQKCPANELVRDGEECGTTSGAGSSFCYHGFCHTHQTQCIALWGQGSIPGDIKCYEKFNPTGNFNGHCGKDRKTGKYTKCHRDHMKCGLLHCAEGEREPRIHVQKTFSMTTVVAEGHSFQCKIVNSASSVLPNLGMVEDGTLCGDRHVCLNHACVSVDDIMTVTCPTGKNNLTCSGRGICTNTAYCFCDKGFMGSDCGIMSGNRSTTWWTMPPSTVSTTTATSTTLRTSPPSTPTSTVAEPAVLMAKKNGVSTLWLIIVLASVAGGGCLIFGMSMLCYRRRSPERLKKYQKRKLWFNRILPPPLSSKSSDQQSNRSSEDALPRLISFGNMPSYRADKIKALRKSMGAVSEAGSENSGGGERESTEIKMMQTIPVAMYKIPERGILKKAGSRGSNDNILLGATTSRHEAVKMQDCGLQCEMECLLPDMTSPEDESLPDSPRSLQEPILPSDTDNETQRRQSGSHSDDSCEKPPLTPSDEENNSSEHEEHWKAREAAMEYKYDEAHQSDGSARSSGSHGSNDSNGPPPSYRKAMGRSGSSSSSDGATSGRARKMKNLEDILKQIDKQAHALVNLKSPLRESPLRGSPRSSNSDENRSSETEADRHFPRGSFYKQSDSDSATSPTKPPPLMPRRKVKSPPKVPPHPQRQYSPLHIQIPGMGPAIGVRSPGRSPPQRRSPQLGIQLRNTPSPLVRSSLRRSPPKELTRRASPPESVDLPKEPALRYVAPKLQSPPKFGTPLRDFSPTGYGGPVYGTPVYESTTTNTGSPVHKPTPPSQPSPSHTTTHSSPKHHRTGAQSPPTDPLNAIPYRRAKYGSNSSIQGSPPQARRKAADSADPQSSSSENPSPHPPECPPKPQQYMNKLTHPLLDGYPFKRYSLAHDGQSQSEGYHSDKADLEDLIIREIPTEHEQEPEVPNRRDSYNLSADSTERVDL